MSTVAEPKATPSNRIGLTVKEYGGLKSTLCVGCGHDVITRQITQALYEMGVPPFKVGKLSGIGCSSKTTAYFADRGHGFNAVHGRMPAIATGAAPIVLGAAFFLPFVALVVLTVDALLYGRRLVRTLGPSLPDPALAARALHTPSWKRSFWEKPPFDSLLLPEARPSSGEVAGPPSPPPAAPGSESATVTRPADASPRER